MLNDEQYVNPKQNHFNEDGTSKEEQGMTKRQKRQERTMNAFHQGSVPKCMAWILILVMTLNLGQVSTHGLSRNIGITPRYDTGEVLSKKVMFMDPQSFDPHDERGIKFKWNFEYDTTADIVVSKDKDSKVIRTLESGVRFGGDLVVHESKWDGKDSSGNYVEPGVYTIQIRPIESHNPDLNPDVDVTQYISIVEFLVTSKKDTRLEKTTEGTFEISGPVEPATKAVYLYVGTEANPIRVPVKSGEDTFTYTLDLPDENVENAILVTKSMSLRKGVKSPGSDAPHKTEEVFAALITYRLINGSLEYTSYSSDLLAGLGEKGLLDGIQCASGDPVNLANGNFLYSSTDITLEGYQGLTFQRFYNAQSGYFGMLGACVGIFL